MFLWISVVYAAELQPLDVDGTTVVLSGTHRFSTVRIVNGGIVRVIPHDGTGGGDLQLTADRILVDATSRIEGLGAGFGGQVDAPGGGPTGGSRVGSGGGHGGAGALGRADDCSVTGPLAPGNAQDLGPGSAGGGTAVASGGDGGAVVHLIAADLTVAGVIDVSGADVTRAGGGSGGTVLLEADHLVCTGRLLAHGGSGGGGGGGGIVEARWDSAGGTCVVDVAGGGSACGPAGDPGVSRIGRIDWDGDGATSADGDCAPRDPDRHPGVAVDVCDGLDEDCDGAIDEDESQCGGCDRRAGVSGTYLFCKGSEDWDTALDRCRQVGAYELASLDDDLSNDEVWSEIQRQGGQRWWIGAHDGGLFADRVFGWSSGAPLVWGAFRQAEPDNAGNDNCVVTNESGQPEWIDVSCGDDYSWVCEACPPRNWFVDADSDGVGTRHGESVIACAPPAGFVAVAGDCDDTDATVGPHRLEICNGRDDDCDGVVDDAMGTAVAFEDADGDGAGDRAAPVAVTCDDVGGGVALAPDDCDDGDPARHVGAFDACDGRDDDCDGEIDEDEGCGYEVMDFADHPYLVFTDPQAWSDARATCDALDYDFASVGTVEESLFLLFAGRPRGLYDTWIGGFDVGANDWRWDSGEPFDFAPWDVSEPNGTDEDCLEMRHSNASWNDEACVNFAPFYCEAACDGVWYVDADSDGSGGAILAPLGTCGGPGVSRDAADCDDADSSVHPGAPDAVGDGRDADCVGGDRCTVDADGDGYGGPTIADCDGATPPIPGDCDDADPTVHPFAFEIRGDGIDQDCDAVEICFVDGDGDGIGGPVRVDDDLDCTNDGLVVVGGDCDDADPAVGAGCAEDGSWIGNPGCDCQVSGWGGAWWFAVVLLYVRTRDASPVGMNAC